MDDDILSIGGDHPLIFGIQCPWCGTSHLVVSLGANPTTEDGEDIEIDPTIGLVSTDEENDLLVVKCWECLRVFRIHLAIILPDEIFEEQMN